MHATLTLAASETWGFILESCWTLRTNFPMPARGEASRLEDDQLPITVDAQVRLHGANGVLLFRCHLTPTV